MFAAEWRWQGVWHSFPFLAWDLSMQPRAQIWISTNLYALEHVHVVQIWIMHINALKTQLMHKNVQTNPEKSRKLTQHSCCSILTREKFESKKRQRISFHPQRWDVRYRKPSWLLWEAPVWEKLRFVRSIYPNMPQMGQKIYHGMLMPLHDSMPSLDRKSVV